MFHMMRRDPFKVEPPCPACAAGVPKKEILTWRPDITKDEQVSVDAARLKRPTAAPDPEKKE